MVTHFSGLLELYAGILTIKNERSMEKDMVFPTVTTLHLLEEAHGMIPFKSTEDQSEAKPTTGGLDYVHKEHKHRV